MRERLTLTTEAFPAREDYMPLPSGSDYILAVDASCYAIRMVLCNAALRVLESLECRPDEVSLAKQFIRDISRKYHCFRTVGSPLSRWPPDLEKALAELGVNIQWLSPDLMRAVGWALAPWNKRRRLHRAGLMAYLAQSRPSPDYRSARDLALFWEGCVAHETLGDVQSELYPEQSEGFAE